MRVRLVFLSCFLFLLFSFLIVKFYWIQIAEGNKWEQVAKRQHFMLVQEPFKRGVFWSNTQVKKKHPTPPVSFVADLQKYHLFIDPLSIPESSRNKVTTEIRAVLGANAGEIEKDLEKKSRSRKVAMWLEKEERDKINAFWLPFAKMNKIPRNALYFVKDYKRSYPFGSLLGQVLHGVQSQKEESTLQSYPTGGLELSLNEYLKGKLGKKLLMRSPRHSFETSDVIEHPKNGADVYLTINHVLQAICEEGVKEGVEACRAKGGFAVMMDPKTGEILALAQYPFFNPADYRTYFNDPELIEHTKLKCITDAFEPGSVMKAITVACALQANRELINKLQRPLFDPEEMIPCANGHFPGRIKPIQDVRLHRYLDMKMAVQKSSNIYMGRLIQRVCEKMGDGWYRSILQDAFGFGQKTGIELLGESQGVLPMPGKLHPNGKLQWSKATPFSLAMGYNLQANAIQTLRAISVFANDGYLVKPTLVRKICDQEGAVLVDHTKRTFPKVLDSSVCKQVVEAMRYVLKPGGSATRADVPGFTCAGKTSTINKLVGGNYSNKHHVASFVGFALTENPPFVLLVSLDEPSTENRGYFGGVAATPLFKKIATRALEYLGEVPDDPEKIAWKQEVKRLQEKYEKWNMLPTKS